MTKKHFFSQYGKKSLTPCRGYQWKIPGGRVKVVLDFQGINGKIMENSKGGHDKID